MTERQLGSSVHHGRRLTFHRDIPLDDVTGYLGGIDDVHYLVLVPQENLVMPVLVPRRGVVRAITLHPESTLESEPLYAVIDGMLSPFREWVRRHLLLMDPPKSR